MVIVTSSGTVSRSSRNSGDLRPVGVDQKRRGSHVPAREMSRNPYWSSARGRSAQTKLRYSRVGMRNFRSLMCSFRIYTVTGTINGSRTQKSGVLTMDEAIGQVNLLQTCDRTSPLFLCTLSSWFLHSKHKYTGVRTERHLPN